jgi:hypothetical protein
MMRFIAIFVSAALVLNLGRSHAEEDLRATLQAKLDQSKKILETSTVALEKATDEAEKKKHKASISYEQSMISNLQARLPFADKADAALREEITPLLKAIDATTALADIEKDPAQQKALNEKIAAMKKQISQTYTELGVRLEERLTRKFGQSLSNEPFDQVIAAVGREGNARIRIDESVGNIRPPLTLDARTKTLRDVLRAAAANANSDIQIDQGEVVILSSDEKWKRETRQKLSRKVTFEFVDTPLEEAIAFLRSLVNVTIVIDPKVIAGGLPTINLRVTDMGVDLALQWILRLADLEYDLRHRAVYVSKDLKNDKPVNLKADVLSELEKGSPEAVWKMEMVRGLSRQVSFEFVDTPVEEALNFLNSLSKVNIIVDPKAAAQGATKTPVTLRVQDMDMYETFYWICKLTDMQMELRNQAIFITPRPAPAVEAKAAPPAAELKAAPGGKVKLKLTNGNELEADADALNQVGALKDFVVNQMTDSAADGALFYKLPDDKPELLADVKTAIAKFAPAAKVVFDEKLKLLAVTSDDVKTLRLVAAMMRELNIGKITK